MTQVGNQAPDQVHMWAAVMPSPEGITGCQDGGGCNCTLTMLGSAASAGQSLAALAGCT